MMAAAALLCVADQALPRLTHGKRSIFHGSIRPACWALLEPVRTRKGGDVTPSLTALQSSLRGDCLGCQKLRSFGSRPDGQGAAQKRLPPARAKKDRAGGVTTEQDRKQTELMDSNQEGRPPTTAIAVVTSIVLVVGATAYLIPGGPPEWIKWFEEQIESAGPLAPVYYAAAYCFTTVAFIPASILTLAAGYIFGPVVGTAVVSVSSTLGAGLGFLISRYAARPFLEERLANNKKFLAVNKAISKEGWKVVVLLRLSPLFGFALSNYALGLTRIEFLPFMASSWVGMLPATFAYVYLGSAGKATVDAIASGEGLSTSPLQLGLYGLGAVATLGVTALISRIASKALSEAEGEEEK